MGVFPELQMAVMRKLGPSNPLIGDVIRQVRQRPLTQVIRVATSRDIPSGYFRIAVQNACIYSKVHVLSHRELKPIFVESENTHPDGPLVYWAHESILPQLATWLKHRAFSWAELAPQS